MEFTTLINVFDSFYWWVGFYLVLLSGFAKAIIILLTGCLQGDHMETCRVPKDSEGDTIAGILFPSKRKNYAAPSINHN